MDREGVLSSLQKWFEFTQTQDTTVDDAVDRDDPPSDSLNQIMSSALAAKDKLMDIHSEVVNSAYTI